MNTLTAGIVIIGDEVLSGRTADTNSTFIAKQLIKVGTELQEIRVIQDDFKTIKNTIIEFHKNYKYVFSTGGIGPTHDDITSESIAAAFNKKYCIHPKAFEILEKYYPKGKFTYSRQKMAMLPEDVNLINNPLTAAPGFIIENVYVFPGVPEIMKKMFINILPTMEIGNPKKISTINTNLYESILALKLSQIQNKNLDCSIGSYPYFDYISKKGGVNIVISSWSKNNLDHINKEIIEMISLLGGKSEIV